MFLQQTIFQEEEELIFQKVEEDTGLNSITVYVDWYTCNWFIAHTNFPDYGIQICRALLSGF